MTDRKIILNLLVSAVLIYGVAGVKTISPEKTSTKKLNAGDKIPAKTIRTQHGDIYDCIDFYEQPAFDHPLLKNHDYHFDMKPTSLPNKAVAVDNEKDKEENKLTSGRVECPMGTVPIRRTTTENRLSDVNPPQVNDAPAQQYFAGSETNDGIDKIYGATGYLSVHNPSLQAFNQCSNSIISIKGGNELLHAGWTVHPQLYGDYNTRFYIWMHAANESCYNVMCPGFVIVNAHHPIDMVLKEAGNTGGPKMEFKFNIYQEKQFGNWWLTIGEGNTQIGFWPKHLFSTLSDGADKVYYGGVVTVPAGTDYPEMGTGIYPHIGFRSSPYAYIRHMSIMDQDGNEQYAYSKSTTVKTRKDKYNARYMSFLWFFRKGPWASTILFGGGN